MSVTAYLPSPATQCTAMQQPGSSLNFSFSRFSQSSTIWLEGGAPSSNGQSCRKKREEKRKWCQWPPFLGNQNKRSEKAELQGKKNVVAAARTPVELVFLHNLNLRLEGTPPPNLNVLHNKNQNKKNKTIAWYTGGENPEQWKKKKKTTFVLVWNIRSHDEVRSVNSPEPGFPLSPPGWHHRWPHKLSQPWWLHIFSTPVITCHRIYERKRQTRLLKLPQDTKVGRHVKIPTKRSENEFADVCKH